MIGDLTASHLVSQMGAFEEQRANNALLRIFDLPGGPTSQATVTLSLQSFPLPKVNVEANETHYLNERRKFAGAVTFDDIELVCKDFVDVMTAHILKTWHEKVYNPATGAIGLARDYKKMAQVELFAPNGTMSRFYSLTGVWPKTFNPGDIDMTSSAPLRITMTLAVDKVYANRIVGSAALIPMPA